MKRNGVHKRGAFWQAYIEMERSETGARRRKYLSGKFATRKEAEAARDELKREIREGVDPAASRITVSDLLSRYLDAKERSGKCSEGTMLDYRSKAAHILPTFGPVVVGKVRPLAVEELYQGLRAEKNLSPMSIHHIHGLFKSAFAWGVRKRLLARSPLLDVDAQAATSAERRALTGGEAETLLHAERDSEWYPMFALSLSTGMRRGEVCGLKWGDVDLDAGGIVVRSSLATVKNRLVLKSTKTGKSRPIPLPETAVEALRIRQAQYRVEKLAAGPSYLSDGYVFARADGSPIHPNTYTKAFRAAADRCGFHDVVLHGLRHTFATWLVGGGTDFKSVQTIMGHSTPAVTLAIYSHALPGAQAKAVTRIDTNLAAARERRLAANE